MDDTTERELSQIEFEKLVKPLIKYLAENHNPHTTILITSISAELLIGSIGIETEEYLID